MQNAGDETGSRALRVCRGGGEWMEPGPIKLDHEFLEPAWPA